MDCLFCKIIAGDIPSTKVFENEHVYAFRDINPQAPVHVLVVPKKHMANVLECDAETAGHLTEAIGIIARRVSTRPASAPSPTAARTAARA